MGNWLTAKKSYTKEYFKTVDWPRVEFNAKTPKTKTKLHIYVRQRDSLLVLRLSMGPVRSTI